MSSVQLYTQRAMAAVLRVREHRVRYVLSKREQNSGRLLIPPVTTVGHVRLYSADGLARVRHELTRIEAYKAEHRRPPRARREGATLWAK